MSRILWGSIYCFIDFHDYIRKGFFVDGGDTIEYCCLRCKRLFLFTRDDDLPGYPLEGYKKIKFVIKIIILPLIPLALFVLLVLEKNVIINLIGILIWHFLFSGMLLEAASEGSLTVRKDYFGGWCVITLCVWIAINKNATDLFSGFIAGFFFIYFCFSCILLWDLFDKEFRKLRGEGQGL